MDTLPKEDIADALWPALENDEDFEAFANSPYILDAGGRNLARERDLERLAPSRLISLIADIEPLSADHALILAHRLLYRLARLAD